MQEVLLDQQVKTIESFGVNISDQMCDQIEQGIAGGLHDTPLSLVFIIPIAAAIMRRHHPRHLGHADGRRRHVQAGLRHPSRHSGVIIALPILVRDAPQLRHRPAGQAPTWRRSCRCSRKRRFMARFLGAIDLFCDVVVRQRRRSASGRAVQAEDRRHRRHVPGHLRVIALCSPSCGLETK